ncbi:MAG TPA: DUF6152 family protein [Flavitalea sp.]|nr:DUF6152 family protein [Flavitalea sp.]HTF28919.1 DUF6152 family protein [Flavitalea sp.]
MKQWKTLAAGISIVVAFSFTVLHHGWANYDQTKTLDYKGTVVEFKFENPHSTAKVTDDKKKTWMVILAPVSRMDARGVPKEKIVKGSSIRVVGYPHKEVKDEMRAERIYVEGNKFELR